MIKHSSKTLKFHLLFISENHNEDPLQDVKKFKWGYKRKKNILIAQCLSWTLIPSDVENIEIDNVDNCDVCVESN